MRIRYLSVIAIFVILGLGSLAAQTPADTDPAALQKRVQQLEQLVKGLQEKVSTMEAASGKQAQPAPAAAAQAKPGAAETKPQAPQAASKEAAKPKEAAVVPVVTFGRDGFAIASPDKTYRLKLSGVFQLDGKFFYGNNTYYSASPHQLINNFQIRKIRPILEGSMGKYIDFRFVPDFGTGKAQIFDAYMDFKFSPYAVIRAGKYKTPLGLQLVQGDTDLPFIERSLATDLVLNRSEGVQLSGNIKGRVTYQAAISNSMPVGQTMVDNATNRGKDIATRLFFTPFASSKILGGLGFGAAATTGRQEGAVLPTLNTTGGQTAFFTYGSGSGSSAVVPTAAGHRTNFSPQAYYYYGPIGLMAEYAESKQKVSAVVSGSTVSEDINHHAWQVEGAWVMTGEKKSYKTVVPRKGLEGKNSRGLGAWELVARYSAMRIDPTVFTLKFADPTKAAQAARNWAVGLNWYMNYFVKFAFNYEQTRFEGGAAPNASYVTFSNRPTEKVFVQRLQFVF